MGLQAVVDSVGTSRRHVVHARLSAGPYGDDGRVVRIACSDHRDRGEMRGCTDIYAWTDECPSGPIERLADFAGVAVPPGYSAKDFARRSIVGRHAAACRAVTRRSEEADMVAAVIDELRDEPDVSDFSAKEVIARLYPAVRRAQRRRVTDSAVRTLMIERKIADAGEDETTLVGLAVEHPEARDALLRLVGVERFTLLRPAGFPRALWHQER
jgi:hypothetical protein